MFCSAAEELIDRKEANANDTPATRARRTFDKGKRYIHAGVFSVSPPRASSLIASQKTRPSLNKCYSLPILSTLRLRTDPYPVCFFFFFTLSTSSYIHMCNNVFRDYCLSVNPAIVFCNTKEKHCTVYIIVSNVNDRIEQNGLEQLVHVFDFNLSSLLIIKLYLFLKRVRIILRLFQFD